MRESSARQPPAELDSCGIGFVADAHGHPSRTIVDAALTGLACVKHRGALAADARTSDGAGILTTIPPTLFGTGNGVLTLFVRGEDPRAAVEAAALVERVPIVSWRTPPTDDAWLGVVARATEPLILQAILGPPQSRDGAPSKARCGTDDPERAAYRLRHRIRQTVAGTYVVSCSYRTLTYKGLIAADHLADFWLDLADPEFVTPLAIFHQRFSTNTLPAWERAQPFRTLCHNGEINALAGNESRMAARDELGTVDVGLGPEELFRPMLDPSDSDSGKIDEAVELLTRGGRPICHAVSMLVPPAWEGRAELDGDIRGFHRYHSALMEPWDGPAGLVFSDGVGIGAALDRNGLRPLRWAVCDDGFVACCSEAGAVPLEGHGQAARGRLGPGQMLFVDPTRGVLHNEEVTLALSVGRPYARWAAEGFRPMSIGEPVQETPEDLTVRQVCHGYTKEELAMILRPMSQDAHEPTFSMGDDSPLPNLAGHPRPVHHYLRQRFAQVTNPPIDPLRERLVMTLRTLIGPREPVLTETAEAAHLLELPTFFLYPDAVGRLLDGSPWPVVHLDACFDVSDGPDGLRAAAGSLADEAAAAVAAGAGLVIVDNGGLSRNRAPIPSLLAAGAVHHRLVETRLRTRASIVSIADDARDVHAITMLLAVGVDAICPRLALHTVAADADASDDELESPEAQTRYQEAVEAGVLKILSKMGISTVDSYRGAHIFEAVGLGREIVDACFGDVPSPLAGIGWEALGADALAHHARAFPTQDTEGASATETARGDRAAHPGDRAEPRQAMLRRGATRAQGSARRRGRDGSSVDLETPGYYRVRKGGEYHVHGKDEVQALNDLTLVQEDPPDGQTREMMAAHLLQRAIRDGSTDRYERFAEMVDERLPTEPHDLLDALAAGPPVPLDEVEPANEITRRFSTGAMSHGSLSREAHENLARAMNLVGGMSNCGEGGEDPERYRTRGLGRDDRNSRIKQIASGRFGVTPEYVAFADELNIKIAQGSKPGEGGQLPGHKVSEEIARLRHTQPGVGLISPPPHHDIYSIEDLAQLIYDLKQVNAAHVSVKLVAEQGVGTVAAGCVKGLADVVQISGANGGTGASPLSSIKHAGLPWEVGLAEAQQVLVENGLRSRCRLRVDGGFLTGRQVMMAALLGADEYSFGTAAMVAEGCILLRACHRDTCKPGVATQRPHLRANFTGTPEGVAAYFCFVAEDVRRRLAALGLRSLDEAIGRVDLLRQRNTGDARADALDLSPLLRVPEPLVPFREQDGSTGPLRFVTRVELQDPRSTLGDQLLADAYRPLWDGDDVDLSYRITNADRAVGAALSGALALEFGSAGPRGRASVALTGAAGQSFGAFLSAGVHLDLTGEANDYVGKGMGGGRIVIRPPEMDTTSVPVLAGNTCLYGATAGELFVAGAVGERFAVRNSGAVAVVEGAGDHCCEYLTGGVVVVLGSVGSNLGAGMTGGDAFVWAPDEWAFFGQVNTDLVEVVRPDYDALDECRWLIERHVELTGSARATALVVDWSETADHLWQVLPRQRAGQVTPVQRRRVATA